MAEIPVYELGLVVHYNMPHPIPGAGSAIFMHIWTNEEKGTAGCTAMGLDSILYLLKWLDPTKHPLLVQTVQSERCLKDL
jgi:L,D-peptidoglycan transpeptidase YkuD (ErfK/YbiS/YcfS/YnhG family)